MVLSRFGFFALAASLTLALPVARADSFTTGGYYSGNQNDFSGGLGNGFISFELNGSSTVINAAAGNIAGSSGVIGGKPVSFTQVFCVDLNDDIYLNTTYSNASYSNNGTVNGQQLNQVAAGEIAWLLINLAPLDATSGQAETDQNEALQAAIWTVEYSTFVLYNGAGTDNDANMITAYNADLAAVRAAELNHPSVVAGDISQVDWITPNSTTDNVQAQVGLPAAPEPGGLVLLGTGLLGVAGAVRRRFRG